MSEISIERLTFCLRASTLLRCHEICVEKRDLTIIKKYDEF